MAFIEEKNVLKNALKKKKTVREQIDAGYI